MKIFAIGQNYPEHNKELQNNNPTEPVIFMKPDTALLKNNKPFYIPDFSNELHYETELIIRFSRIGKNIQSKFAYRYFDEIGLGVDFTARDLQRKLKAEGKPWEICKAFDKRPGIQPTKLSVKEPISSFIRLRKSPEWYSVNSSQSEINIL